MFILFSNVCVKHLHRKIPISWAQRKDRLVITLKVQDLIEHKIDLKPEGTLCIQAKDKTRSYELNMALYGEVDVTKSKWNTLGRNIILDITKKTSGPFWPRLTKDEKKNQLVQIDWSRYVDEDDEEGKKMDDIGGSNIDDKLDHSDSDDEEEEKKEEAKADLNDLDKKEEKTAPVEPKKEEKLPEQPKVEPAVVPTPVEEEKKKEN